MKCIINAQGVVSEAQEGPLAPFIAAFAKSLSEDGYSLGSLRQQVRIVAFFSRWLGEKAVRLEEVSPDLVPRFLRHRARRVQPHKGDVAALRRLVDLLRRQAVIPAEKISMPQRTPAERCALAYAQYLREDRALAKATIINYVPFIQDFLNDRFGAGRVTLSRLTAGDVVRFVQRQVLRLHIRRAKTLTTALRSFLQYARYRGDVTLDLAGAVPVVANWARAAIPRAIAVDQVRLLLTSMDRRTATGRRDYAILLLLARLGLRLSEVAFLDLDDIDWKAGRLHLCGKAGHRLELPMSTAIGEAIVAYLRHGRPQSSSRRAFLRHRAPIGGFHGASGVGSVVRQALTRADIVSPTKGAHQFRHAFATQMLRGGASLSEIGALLGHGSPETTKIYARVDLDALRPLALPWPRDMR